MTVESNHNITLVLVVVSFLLDTRKWRTTISQPNRINQGIDFGLTSKSS